FAWGSSSPSGIRGIASLAKRSDTKKPIRVARRPTGPPRLPAHAATKVMTATIRTMRLIESLRGAVVRTARRVLPPGHYDCLTVGSFVSLDHQFLGFWPVR